MPPSARHYAWLRAPCNARTGQLKRMNQVDVLATFQWLEPPDAAVQGGGDAQVRTVNVTMAVAVMVCRQKMGVQTGRIRAVAGPIGHTNAAADGVRCQAELVPKPFRCHKRVCICEGKPSGSVLDEGLRRASSCNTYIAGVDFHRACTQRPCPVARGIVASVQGDDNLEGLTA